MRQLFVAITGLFWVGVAYYALHPPGLLPGGAHHRAGSPGGNAPRGLRIPRQPDLAPVSAEELARHNKPEDCWVAIAGTIFDVTGYVDLHPSKHQEMEAYCGKDGTKPWDFKDTGKDRGQPHTKRAAEFLQEYPQVGVFRY